jgi:hypothetical protein
MSAHPHPDTYQGPRADAVDPHFDATIAGHWFYTLVNGRTSAKANDNGCFVSVEPLSMDLEQGVAAASQVVFRAFAALQPADGFLKARELTSSPMFAGQDPAARVTIENAWHAVGVGEAAKPRTLFPKEGQTDVSPWDVTFSWEVGKQAGPWKLRWSLDKDFMDAKVIEVKDVLEDADMVRFATVTAPVPPGATIHWQVVEGSGDVNWKCGVFTSHFSTSARKIDLVSPSTVAKEGHYLVDPLGMVNFERMFPVDHFEARLSDTDDACAEDKPWTTVPVNGWGLPHEELYLGDTISENLVLLRNPVKIRPELDLDENTTYHLYIRAVRGGTRGQCGHFPVRKAKLKPFVKVSPGDFAQVKYKSGGPFLWKPSEGAVRYEIVVDRFLRREPNVAEVIRESVEAASLKPNAQGDLEYTLANKDALSNRGQHFWTVTAVSAQGFRRESGLINVPPTSSSHTPSFWVAPEARFDASFDGGQVGEALGNRTPVSIVRPREQQDKVTRACFDKPANAIGMRYWWGGVSDLPVTLEKIVDVKEDPAMPGKLCTGPLPLRDEPLTLLVRFYSDAIGPPGMLEAIGFTDEHAFDVRLSQCGGAGDACCESSTCASGAICDAGTKKCLACGGDQQPCCQNQACKNTSLVCTASSRCVTCGRPGGPCCGSRCDGSAICSSGTCRECGRLNQACCSGSTCTGTGVQCRAGTCQAIAPCNAKVVAGNNDPVTHVVELGKTRGTVRFQINTFDVPDAFTVTYQGQALIPRTCTPTKNVVGCSVLGWCCNGIFCEKNIPFQGFESTMTVRIEPNCAGTDHTGWEFFLSCPF